ncbi:unnamed protein product, partial [Owenia fusiformis]
ELKGGVTVISLYSRYPRRLIYKMLLFVSTLCLVAAASAQFPARCEAPMEWEGDAASHDHNYKYQRYGKVSYDAYNQRVRFVDKIYFDNRTEYSDSLYLHREHVEYRIDMKTRKCEKRPITWEWYPEEVPRNSTFYGEAYLGASIPEAGVEVSMWGAEYKESSGATVRWNGEFTTVGCIPVHTSRSRSSDYVSTHFYDVTVGISDPNVFIPPKECL